MPNQHEAVHNVNAYRRALGVVAAVVGLVGLVVLVARLVPRSEGPPVPVADADVREEDIDRCERDADCVQVMYGGVCFCPWRAINRRYLKLYEQHPEWQVNREPLDPDFCNVAGQCAVRESPICGPVLGVKRCQL